MSARTVSILRSHDDRLVPVAGVYEIDGAHTSVEFVARHLMITKVRGRFSDVRGRITIAEEPEDSHVEADIGTASLSTGNDDRDTHLRSGDFFDVERYPTITFRSTSVRAVSDGTWEVVGDLTVRDTTRPVTLQVDFDGADVSPARRRTRRIQRRYRSGPRGFRAHLEHGARDRRPARRQDGPHRTERRGRGRTPQAAVA